MPEPVRLTSIGLAKLFLWAEAERIQTYPEAFSRLEEGRTYTRRQVATELFELVYPDKKGRALREDQISNCFGLDRSPSGKVVLRGINCLRMVEPGRFVATPEALAIGRAYRAHNDEMAWAVPLARQIARYEVRTRLLLYLLGRGGRWLTFRQAGFFSQPTVATCLEGEGESVALFQNKGEAFNRLLQEHWQVAIGPWWRAELSGAGYEIGESLQLEGIRSGPPATNKLNSNIKGGLFLMKYLGLLTYQTGGWALRTDRTIEVLGEDIASDLVGFAGPELAEAPLSALRSIVAERANVEGFVAASQVAREWAARNRIPLYRADEAFDEFMRLEIHKGTVSLVGRHAGQLRHGRGLFGDAEARLIKLEFNTGTGGKDES